MGTYRILVFGSRNLGAKHLDVMVEELRAAAAIIPLGVKLVLLHGAGPRGTTPGAIGADMLSEVAAHLAWRGRERGLRRYPVEQAAGEPWGQAAVRRDAAMVRARPRRALCFHTDVALGRGSAVTAKLLLESHQPYTFVHMSSSGAVLNREERGSGNAGNTEDVGGRGAADGEGG